MANPNPHKARIEKKKRRRVRKIDTLTDARRKLCQAITSAEEVLLDDQSDNVTVLKAVNSITSASTAYAKLIVGSAVRPLLRGCWSRCLTSATTLVASTSAPKDKIIKTMIAPGAPFGFLLRVWRER